MRFLTKAFSIMLLSISFANADTLSAKDPIVAQGMIYRTTDGDTFQVNIDDKAYQRVKHYAKGDKDRMRHLNDKYKSVIVRVANVNTAESKHKDESKNTARGKQISKIVTKITEKQDTTMRCYDFGDYGRLICSMTIHGNSGDFDIGHYLIKNGYSEYVTYWGNNPFYHKQYKNASR